MNISPWTYNPTQNECITPEQFRPHPAAPWPVRIAYAVLEDGIDCATREIISAQTPLASARRRQDALDWIASDDNSYLHSFVNVCAALMLDPGYIRRGVQRPGFHFPRGLRAESNGRLPEMGSVHGGRKRKVRRAR